MSHRYLFYFEQLCSRAEFYTRLYLLLFGHMLQWVLVMLSPFLWTLHFCNWFHYSIGLFSIVETLYMISLDAGNNQSYPFAVSRRKYYFRWWSKFCAGGTLSTCMNWWRILFHGFCLKIAKFKILKILICQIMESLSENMKQFINEKGWYFIIITGSHSTFLYRQYRSDNCIFFCLFLEYYNFMLMHFMFRVGWWIRWLFLGIITLHSCSNQSGLGACWYLSR